jgi:hypothetical protein
MLSSILPYNYYEILLMCSPFNVIQAFNEIHYVSALALADKMYSSSSCLNRRSVLGCGVVSLARLALLLFRR